MREMISRYVQSILKELNNASKSRYICAVYLLSAAIMAQDTAPAPQDNPKVATSEHTTEDSAPATSVSTPALAGFGIEDGTPVKLRLTRNLSSATDKKGDTVDFELLEDVSVQGVIVAPRGGVAWATITDAQPKRRMGRGGKLDVNIDTLRLKDGEKIALRAVKDNKGGGHVGAMTGAMVATGMSFSSRAIFPLHAWQGY